MQNTGTAVPSIPVPGDLVEHRTWGLGKIVANDGNEYQIYFKAKPAERPEGRVARIALPSLYVQRVERRTDTELDNLPPWRDGQFVRYRTQETIETKRQTFLRHFNQGFDDPQYLANERGYKEAAHHRYRNLFMPRARGWIEARDHESLINALDDAYGPKRAPKEGPDARLNLLYPAVEEPVYFEALRRAPNQAITYVQKALDFINDSSPNSASFDAFRDALESLPGREGGIAVGGWTTLTWLPFIARPDTHVFVKPTITQEFASLMAFDIRYRPELNSETYAQAVKLGDRLRNVLQKSELNLSRRPLDMIDVQSFMWVTVDATYAVAPVTPTS